MQETSLGPCVEKDIDKIKRALAEADKLVDMINELVYLISGNDSTFPKSHCSETEPKGLIPVLAYEAERVYDSITSAAIRINVLNEYLEVKQTQL